MPHAIVTGASSGIGEAIVTLLLDQGWQVTGLSRSRVSRDNACFRSVQVDMTDEPALIRTLADLPAPDALVHAAGMMAAAPVG
ncbi:SDR family NAD(P)-dependent oxidoreductase, partial [Pantoea piersonii]